jgi:hypothetical protein
MGKVIAIPVTSERRAVVLLAALRRLEAECPVGFPAAGGRRGRPLVAAVPRLYSAP